MKEKIYTVTMQHYDDDTSYDGTRPEVYVVRSKKDLTEVEDRALYEFLTGEKADFCFDDNIEVEVEEAKVKEWDGTFKASEEDKEESEAA